MKLPLVNGETMVKILVNKGFKAVRQRGSHLQLKETVPLHPGRQIGRGLLRKILRDAEITREEYIQLTKKI